MDIPTVFPKSTLSKMDPLPRNFPICFISNEQICTYKQGKFYLVNIVSGSSFYLTAINEFITEGLLSRIKILSRLLRTGVRCGIKINQNEILFVLHKTIFNLNLATKLITKEHWHKNGGRPLSMARIQGIEGFENSFYFGEYFSNPKKNEVNIFKREENGKWNVVGSFPHGLINHIHALIPDVFQNCVWILTGDFDNSAGIWNTDNEFKTINPVMIGDQEYRACVAFPTKDGLLYATDTPFCHNSIRLLNKSNGIWISKKIVDIDGPVIYGCKFNSNFVFSTSVEGNGTEKGFKMLLGRKRGKGIKEPVSCIYYGNLETGFNSIYKNEKDLLPFVLFQFGTIVFPEGENKTNILPFYPIALKKGDLTFMTLKISN